jgi:3-deoxy-D-manno-octulosonic-acid transferase
MTAEYPEHGDLQRLADLRDQGGWQFTVPQPVEGEQSAITGLRKWPDGSADVLAVRDFTDAYTRRTNPAGGTVWKHAGSVGEVVDALLALPAPDDPEAPSRVIASGPGLWTSG